MHSYSLGFNFSRLHEHGKKQARRCPPNEPSSHPAFTSDTQTMGHISAAFDTKSTPSAFCGLLRVPMCDRNQGATCTAVNVAGKCTKTKQCDTVGGLMVSSVSYDVCCVSSVGSGWENKYSSKDGMARATSSSYDDAAFHFFLTYLLFLLQS